jgi:hypothetical protein
MYEAFMAEYGIFPDEVDNRFSLRQMSILIQAQNKRKELLSKLQAQHIWSVVFGNDNKQGAIGSNAQTTKDEKSMSHFGIGVSEGGEE